MSRTLRVNAWVVLRPSSETPPEGASELRARRGFRPTRPQQAAGIRIEPVPSLPDAAPMSPAATAAAEPPLEPPGDSSGLQGFRVRPKSAGSVAQWLPNSAVLVRPQMMSPAAR